jgi:DNA-binding MarR family transcriptional regulator
MVVNYRKPVADAPERRAQAVQLDRVELASLAYFVGDGFNAKVAATLRASGYPEVKSTFGYVIQHLIGGPRSGADLARRLGVTQQAASKRLQEMRQAGLIEDVEDASDSRRRLVALNARGFELLDAARRLRVSEDARIWRGVSKDDLQIVRSAFMIALRNIGLEQAIERRELKESK